MKYAKPVFAIAGLLTMVSTGASVFAEVEPRTTIVAQSTCPLRISQYTARYSQDEGLRHTISYQNRASQKVVAIRFGMLSFDMFHTFIGRTTGVVVDEMDKGKSDKGSWSTSSPSAPAFLTGIVWVDSIRFEDGTIWQGDEAAVVAEARKIDKDFDASLLKDRATLQ